MSRASELFLVFLASAGLTAFVLLKERWYWRFRSRDTEPWVFGKKFSITVSALFLGYGIYGIVTNDLWLPPAGHYLSAMHGIHLHGWPVWWFFLATVCQAVYLTSAMGDKIPSDGLQLFRRLIGAFGWFFFMLSLITWLYVQIKS